MCCYTRCKYCSWTFPTPLEMVLKAAAGFPPYQPCFLWKDSLPFSAAKPSLLFHKFLLGNLPYLYTLIMITMKNKTDLQYPHLIGTWIERSALIHVCKPNHFVTFKGRAEKQPKLYPRLSPQILALLTRSCPAVSQIRNLCSSFWYCTVLVINEALKKNTQFMLFETINTSLEHSLPPWAFKKVHIPIKVLSPHKHTNWWRVSDIKAEIKRGWNSLSKPEIQLAKHNMSAKYRF